MSTASSKRQWKKHGEDKAACLSPADDLSQFETVFWRGFGGSQTVFEIAAARMLPSLLVLESSEEDRLDERLIREAIDCMAMTPRTHRVPSFLGLEYAYILVSN